MRDGTLEDKAHLIEWLKEPGTLNWYPMCNDLEIEDAANYWVSFATKKALLTIECEGEPAGMINLYLQPSEKLKHHALLAIIVKKSMRGKGLGTLLLEAIKKRAKELGLEFLQLEVYEGNPAIRLYKRSGFKEFGFQKRFIKEKNTYIGKHFMQMDL